MRQSAVPAVGVERKRSTKKYTTKTTICQWPCLQKYAKIAKKYGKTYSKTHTKSD